MAMSWARGSVRRAYIALRPLRQFAALGVLLGTGSAALAEAVPADTWANLAYGPQPAQQGDLYLPTGTHGRRAAVLVIHGGGWVEGSRQFDTGLSELIASQGLVVFNIDYRLADKTKPDTRWPAQLVDAQMAVRFLRAHATQFDIDPARIGEMGDSAGAQLAVFLGVLPRNVAGDGAELNANQRPNVAAVVDQFGPMDLPGMGLYAAGSIEALFGVAMPTGAALLTASPLPSIGGHSAPMYILHGEADEVVPFQQSRQLADTLRASDVAVQLVPFAGGHAFKDVPADKIGKLQVDAVKWLVQRLER